MLVSCSQRWTGNWKEKRKLINQVISWVHLWLLLTFHFIALFLSVQESYIIVSVYTCCDQMFVTVSVFLFFFLFKFSVCMWCWWPRVWCLTCACMSDFVKPQSFVFLWFILKPCFQKNWDSVYNIVKHWNKRSAIKFWNWEIVFFFFFKSSLWILF